MVLMLREGRDLNIEAAKWHAEIDEPYMDWAAFEAWLSAGPQHRLAYDDIAVLDAEIGDHRRFIAATLFATSRRVPAPPSTKHAVRIGVAASIMAAAAMIVAVVAGPLHNRPASPSIAIASGLVGRSLAIGDGSRIVLDRNTRMNVSIRDATVVELAQGTANFRIRHDPARTVVVRALGFEIRDVGTEFNVAVSAGHLTVDVAEGEVSIRHSGADTADETVLAAGQRVDLDTVMGSTFHTRIPPESVSAWAKGQLSYNDAPLSIVGADVSRYVDRPLVVDPSAASVRFSGVLTIGDGSRLVDQLKALLPIDSRRVGGVTHLRRTGER